MGFDPALSLGLLVLCLAFAALAMAVGFRGSFWKKGLNKGPKPRRPIPARSGRLRRKAVALRYRPPSPETIAFMEKCRAENIKRAKKCDANKNLRAALAQLGIRYTQEECTWYDGDCWVLSDYWCPDIRMTIELNGKQHKDEKIRDAEKAAIILGQRGFRTVAIWNWETSKPDYLFVLARRLGR